MPDPIINQGTDNQTGSAPADFISMLSPEMQSHPAAAKFKGKGAGDVFQAYNNLESLVNKKQEGMVRIPGADASDDDRRAFHKALGVPEKPDAYELPDFSDLHESLPGGKDWKPHAGMDQWFRDQAIELGLTPAQFQKLYKSQIAWQVKELQELDKAQADSIRSLYGNRYDAAIKEAQRAAGRLSPETQQLVKSDIGKYPVITRVLQELGATLGESQSPDGAGAPMGATQELDELNSKYEKIINSPEYQSGKKASMVKEAEGLLSRILFLKGKIGVKK
jgi:hypothetical protein